MTVEGLETPCGTHRTHLRMHGDWTEKVAASPMSTMKSGRYADQTETPNKATTSARPMNHTSERNAARSAR